MSAARRALPRGSAPRRVSPPTRRTAGQHVGDRGRAEPDRELAESALDRRGAREQTDHGAGPDQRDADETQGEGHGREAGHAEDPRQYRDDRARGEEQEARQGRTPGATDDLVRRLPRCGCGGCGTGLRRGDHVAGLVESGIRVHPARAVDERELVGIQVEVRKSGVGEVALLGGFEQLALRPHRDELPRAHRQGAGEQARDTAEEHEAGGHAGRPDAHHQGEVRHETVVRTEDGGAEGSREASAPARGETADDFVVHAFVGGHRGSRVGLVGVGRAGLGVLGEGEHEDRAEAAGHPREKAGADARRGQALGRLAEEIDPVLLVAALGLGEGEQDVAFLPGAARGELAVHARLGAFVDEIARPAAAIAGGGCGGGRHGCSFGSSPP